MQKRHLVRMTASLASSGSCGLVYPPLSRLRDERPAAAAAPLQPVIPNLGFPVQPPDGLHIGLHISLHLSGRECLTQDDFFESSPSLLKLQMSICWIFVY